MLSSIQPSVYFPVSVVMDDLLAHLTPCTSPSVHHFKANESWRQAAFVVCSGAPCSPFPYLPAATGRLSRREATKKRGSLSLELEPVFSPCQCTHKHHTLCSEGRTHRHVRYQDSYTEGFICNANGRPGSVHPFRNHTKTLVSL